MKLDKKIIEGKRPLTCLDVEQAREFVGKECIFSDSYENFKDLNQYLFVDSDYAAILSIDERASCGDYVFKNSKNNLRYSLILPLEWVKEPEKKWRPYTLAEWVDQHEIGEVIHYRDKDYKQQFRVMYSGYIIDDGEDIQDVRTIGRIVFMFTAYFLEELFKDYEICINGEWHPFGVLDEG